MELTKSLEKHLKNIYLLSLKKRITVTDLSVELNITKAAITKALNKLRDLELIKYEKYGEIVLLKKGETIAVNLVEKENVIELFLTSVLNITKDNAKKDLESISLHITDETKEKLFNYIKNIVKIDEVCHCNNQNKDICKECHINVTKNNVFNNPKWEQLLKTSKE